MGALKNYLITALAAATMGFGFGECHGHLHSIREPPVTHIKVSTYDPKLKPIAQVFYVNGTNSYFTSIDGGVMVPHPVAFDIKKGKLTLEEYLTLTTTAGVRE